MTAEMKCNVSSVNLSWKDRCKKLLVEVEEKNPTANDVKGKTDIILKKKKELENMLKLTEEEIEKASLELKEIENKDDNKPISSYLLKLYNLITKLKFDIESPPNEPKGYVAGKSLDTFQFDRAKNSQQFIVDSLWNLIESQLKQKMAKKHSVDDWFLNRLDCPQIKRLKVL